MLRSLVGSEMCIRDSQNLIEASECKRKDLDMFRGYIGISILPYDHEELNIEDIYPSLKAVSYTHLTLPTNREV